MANKGSNKPLAAIYGQALYEAAAAAGALERVTEELAALKETLAKDAKLGEFFESPVIAFEDKRKVIEAVFKGHSDIARNFVLVLISRSRSQMFGEIVDAYNAFAQKQSGIAAVEVQTARELQPDEREKLVKILQNKLGKKIQLAERVNPDLIGGLVLLHDDKLWDGSLRHKLNEVISRMEETKTSAVKWSE